MFSRSVAREKLQRVVDAHGFEAVRGRADCSVSTLYGLMNGSLERPSLVIAARLERFFGVRCVDWCFSEKSETEGSR